MAFNGTNVIEVAAEDVVAKLAEIALLDVTANDAVVAKDELAGVKVIELAAEDDRGFLLRWCLDFRDAAAIALKSVMGVFEGLTVA